jgi:hypothetical protein
MSTGRYFNRVALAVASTVMIAACSSDTPTSPATASQSLTAAAPTIALNPTGFRLCYPGWVGSTRGCASGGYVAISNSGGGTLNWTVTKTATWLKISTQYGTAPSTMGFHVDGTGLPHGTYYGQIRVWATGATNSPRTVYVTMQW